MNREPDFNAIPELAGRVLIVGLGKTGMSCVRALAQRGLDVAVTDTRLTPPGLAELRSAHGDLPCRLGRFVQNDFDRADLILLSPGVPLAVPELCSAIRRGVPVWGDVELFARLVRAPVVAITGSNGKSTVTSLVAAMAREAGIAVAEGGNLGTPVLDLAHQPADLYVIELSSFQLETTYSLNAQAATVLNVSPDHLDRYPSLDAYAMSKARVFNGHGWQVINRDDARVAAMVQANRMVSTFGLGPAEETDFGLLETAGDTWLARGAEPLLATREVFLPGRHNHSNALAALALGWSIGMDRDSMLLALRTFRGLPHRSQLVAERLDVRYYDDSKGTNVGATVAAIRGLPGHMVLIAGGQGKGQDFTPLLGALAGRARGIVLMGEDRGQIRAILGSDFPIRDANDMDEAVVLAAALARPGDSVLLSPACASFDQFSNFEARGRAFQQAVGKLSV